MRKKSDTEILKAILDCKRELGLDTLPSARQVIEFGVCSGQLVRIGGLSNVSQMTGIPMYGNPEKRELKKESKKRGEKKTEADVIKRVLDLKEELGIEHLPTFNQIVVETWVTQNDMRRIGGLKRISQEYGIEMKDKKNRPIQKVRISRAFEKDKAAKAEGKRYKDVQTADTLAKVGSIDTSRYGVEKVKAL